MLFVVGLVVMLVVILVVTYIYVNDYKHDYNPNYNPNYKLQCIFSSQYQHLVGKPMMFSIIIPTCNGKTSRVVFPHATPVSSLLSIIALGYSLLNTVALLQFE